MQLTSTPITAARHSSGSTMPTKLSPSLQAIVLFFLVFVLKYAAGNGLDDRISINCGSASPAPSIGGRKWMADVYPLFSSSAVTVRGISSRTSVSKQPIVDPVPYGTARISSSQFSYYFELNPGQKYIRLHFNPTLYKFNSGFFKKKLEDYFSVEAGPFTLLNNFSASITARALGLNVVTKEFCVDIRESMDFSLVFTPAIATNPSHGFYAFINGIEIISAPSSLSYCHNGDLGVQIVGQKSVVYIDSSTALEMAYRLNVKRDFVPFDDNIGMFRMGAAVVEEKANDARYSAWKVSVDVGFRYLIRLHFSERGLKMSENGSRDFMILINGTIAISNADVFHEREVKSFLWHTNYMVMVNGNKREGKRSILISLESEDEFVDGYGPLEGFEIFKLSNHDNSLASPNPLPPTGDSLSLTTRNLLASLGPTNSIAAVVIMLTCLVSIVVHKLQQSLEGNLLEDENVPSARAASLCRCFSLAEIRSATEDFYGALIIGKGGFGKVYRGRMDNGKLNVAIKRLRASSNQGKLQFQAEIELLSELRHVNLVSLLGYCSEKGEMILVYEYVPNGSLAYHLYKLARESTTSSLSWKQRLEICIGAGRGLDYLHTGHGIVHRDIKASNILLDENFVAKVSDFGLAKIHTGQTQASTNFKGTFGHVDPDYFRTHRMTLQSDIYSFGVMLLEVLCGRPAIEPWAEEEKRSLTTWARDKISKGEVDEIIAPNLRDEISPVSLNAFLRIVERCLYDEPKKRPAIAHVIINLEFALEQQKNANSSVSNEIAAVADALSFIDTAQSKNVNSLSPNEIKEVADATGFTEIFAEVVRAKTQPLLTTQTTVGGTRQQIVTSSNMKNVTSFKSLVKTTVTTSSNTESVASPLKTVVKTTVTTSSNTKNFTSPFKNVVKTTVHKLSRLLPRGKIWKGGKSAKKKEAIGSISAPIARRAASMKPRDSTISESRNGEDLLLAAPNLRVFPFKQLLAITRNFHFNTVIGEGGYGRVYKAFLQENGVKSCVAIKKLLPDSMQGIEEWLSEVNFLGKLSHPNLVKLVGYCLENNQQLLVYEFMEKGSLERSLFRRYATPLQWDTRLSILIGAARGLAYLHASEIIYRDLKSSNILLDQSYQAKLSDFGLAKWGPDTTRSHVTTRVMGTHGYAAPEYITTGHLYVKSDMYSFGVVLLEMLTGLRALDVNRPSGQQNLVHWIRPQLSNKRKLSSIMDPRLEEGYPAKCAFQIAQLARKCLEVEPKRRPSSQEVVEALEKMQ